MPTFSAKAENDKPRPYETYGHSHGVTIRDAHSGTTTVIENGFWQGTLIYMEIGTGEEIDPSQIVDHRTDVAEEYNEAFVETEELESLW